jgi:16S rRNA processing protein RimM
MTKSRFPSHRKNKQSSNGSPNPGEPSFLVVGRLRRPHGIQGDLTMEVLTDFPERLHIGKTLYIGDNYTPYVVEFMRPHDKLLIIGFEGIYGREEASLLRSQYVYVPIESLPSLPEGEYYHHQLLGLHAYNDTGEELGKLSQIIETGANDIYVVRTDEGKELLFPAIKEIILEIDIANKKLIVKPLEWY